MTLIGGIFDAGSEPPKEGLNCDPRWKRWEGAGAGTNESKTKEQSEVMVTAQTWNNEDCRGRKYLLCR